MKRFFLILAAIALSALPATAEAARDKPYFSVKGGANWIQDDAGIELDTGWDVLGAAGYNVTENVRTELEAGWSTADVDGGGDVDTITAMLNGYYDFNMNSRIKPYLGVGLGAAHQQLTGAGTSWEFAYQGMAGAAYDITKATAVTAEYRYLGTSDVGAFNYDAHKILAGLRFAY
ncbi:MAG: outer membrane protein [Bdellovibrionales bacterium]